MTDVKIKTTPDGQPEEVSVGVVNKKLEAFVEILMSKFHEQHDRLRTLEQQVKELKKQLKSK